jgi:hypothetical protein
MNKEEKQNVLGNIKNITSKDLANYILKEELTLEELMNTGELEAPKRIEIINFIKECEEEQIKKEEIEWGVVSKTNNVQAIESFIEKYPKGRFFREACDLLVYLRDMQKEKSKIIKDIKENSNKYTPDVILEFIENNVITEEDLLEIGIPDIIIQNLNTHRKDLVLGKIPDIIENGYTEVYFWGLPSSGKTCALSAILSTGVKMGDIDPQEGLGQHYMGQLSNIFLNKCSVLPPPTHTEYTQYLPFDLYDDNKVKHPIALIELSGEVFRAFYKDQNDLELDEELQSTLDRTKEYLCGGNKKIHFFIFDITNDPTKPDNENVTQQQFLRSMTNYLDKNNIFKNTTDGVYIITTKSDVLCENSENRKELAISHLNENYKSFINSLKGLLKKNRLSDTLHVIPFSLGEVYFNELCYFDDSKSREVIELLKSKTSKKTEPTIWSKLKSYLNK